MQLIQSNNSYFRAIFLMVSFFCIQSSTAQELKIITSYSEYKKMAENDSLNRMVDLQAAIPGAVLDLRYATKNNFTGKKLYAKGNKTYVRLAVANELYKVQNELAAQGYYLKIWDAYRPFAVTKEMWELIGDERYVANPAKGSGHNRGLSVDLTLVKDGKELDMGTGFDNFTDTAHHIFNNLPQQVLANRQLLKTTMEKYGFKALYTEWWHYSFPNDRAYDVLDISFKKLGKK